MIEEEVEKKIMEREKRKVFNELCSNLRHERRTIGVRFYDAVGTGRLLNGKKKYD